MKKKEIARTIRHKRLRKKIVGTDAKPRLTVHRSLGNLYAQFVDDINGKTICSICTLSPEMKKTFKYGGNVKAAQALGQAAASLAKSKNISKVVFDRGGYTYHGRVKAFAETAKKNGIEF